MSGLGDNQSLCWQGPWSQVTLSGCHKKSLYFINFHLSIKLSFINSIKFLIISVIQLSNISSGSKKSLINFVEFNIYNLKWKSIYKTKKNLNISKIIDTKLEFCQLNSFLYIILVTEIWLLQVCDIIDICLNKKV